MVVLPETNIAPVGRCFFLGGGMACLLLSGAMLSFKDACINGVRTSIEADFDIAQF